MISAEKVAKKLKNFDAEIGIILGSGYENLVELENAKTVSYKSLGLDFCEVQGHTRQFVFGKFKGKKIVFISRLHFYESGSTENIFNLFKVLSLIGVKTILSTTAVGAVNAKFKEGDIMLVEDHINLTGNNPLIAKQPIKFVDLNNAYDKTIGNLALKTAEKLKIELLQGVHLQATGPTYETPAEVKFFEKIGADTVSMSTAFDCICAKYFDIKFASFAGITNKCLTPNSKPITHAEVLNVSKKICKKLSKLIQAILPLL
ncbi:MAG: purine-nucleoside phosphorylase [Clostridia bacterium]|nr:purine-nucleoside phosphorylase [Clostridia bacterium]